MLLYGGTGTPQYVGHNIMSILYSTYYRSINQDHDDHTPFMLAVYVTTHLQGGRLIRAQI